LQRHCSAVAGSAPPRAEKGLRAKPEKIRPVANLQEFFKDSVADAMEKQGVAADDHTAYYVVNLLTLFARAEKLYDRRTDGPGPPPLALLLAEAAATPDREVRNVVLQRVGDTALFVAGFFQEAFARKLVDVDYYIDVGGSLSESVRGTIRGRAFHGVFAELAAKFREFVDVLAEIRDSARAADDHDILRLYEVWLKTGSLRAARVLRSLGIEPSASLDATTRH
jgi:hypothetical protein